MAAQQQAPALTAMAGKYSHPLHGRDPITMTLRFNHEWLRNRVPLKSGLSPIKVDDVVTEQDAISYRIWSGYQPYRMQSKSTCDVERLNLMVSAAFTAEELEASEAWAPSRTGDEYDVLTTAALHPLVEKSRWTSRGFYLHQAPFPIRQGIDGYWEVRFASSRV